jgi:hypothetical protein
VASAPMDLALRQPEPKGEDTRVDPPRWPFLRGLIAGVLVVIPLTALVVWAVAVLGTGQDLSLVQVTRTAALFAGVAAVLTAGGIGRLAAEASATGGKTRGVYVGARTQAVASAGLVVIAALPQGALATTGGWIGLAVVGAASGAAAGAVIGFACSAARPVALSDVVALARWPQEAIRRAATVVGQGDSDERVRRVDGDPTPLPVPVPLGETAPMTVPPAVADVRAVTAAEERPDPTPLPAPVPLGEAPPPPPAADAVPPPDAGAEPRVAGAGNAGAGNAGAEDADDR